MTIVAVYNMKGGVGKTTTAVNLSYLAAAGGQRTLLWDLDPQAASTFALRVRPRVEGFGRKSLENGETFRRAIKETDYGHLDLLPADFSYRKLDRLLGQVRRPARVVTTLLDTVGRDYDAIFLDCPPGFSLLTDAIFATADAVLVPTIPTVLSLRTVERLIRRARRASSRSELAVFFNMVDRRKALHRQVCAWSVDHPEVFLTGRIPYASVVEQMSVRRMPLAAFASRDSATAAFADLWTEFHTRLSHRTGPYPWAQRLEAIESLIARIESADGVESVAGQSRDAASAARSTGASMVHSFDTELRDLQRSGLVLELQEGDGRLLVVAARAGEHVEDAIGLAQVRIDRTWALDILSGALSPLVALDRRLGRPGPVPVENIRAVVGEQPLHRIASRAADGQPLPVRPHDRVIPFDPSRTPRRQVSWGDEFPLCGNSARRW